MTDRGSDPAGPDRDPAHIDIEFAQPARMSDYLLGGDSSFSVDRTATDYAAEGITGGIETAKALARTGEAFLNGVVEHLAGHVGIRQFLNVGTQIPTGRKIHEVAQGVAPTSRVVYVFNDPTVLAHAHTLLRSGPEGATAFVHSSLRDPDRFLREAEGTLDLHQPLAVLLYVVIQFLDRLEAGRRLIARILDHVPSGTYLMIAHMASDLGDDIVDFSKRLAEAGADIRGWAMYPRTYAEISSLFDGLELVEPGLVPVDRWMRHHGMTVPTGDMTIPAYGGLGVKP